MSPNIGHVGLDVFYAASGEEAGVFPVNVWCSNPKFKP